MDKVRIARELVRIARMLVSGETIDEMIKRRNERLDIDREMQKIEEKEGDDIQEPTDDDLEQIAGADSVEDDLSGCKVVATPYEAESGHEFRNILYHMTSGNRDFYMLKLDDGATEGDRAFFKDLMGQMFAKRKGTGYIVNKDDLRMIEKYLSGSKMGLEVRG